MSQKYRKKPVIIEATCEAVETKDEDIESRVQSSLDECAEKNDCFECTIPRYGNCDKATQEAGNR